ncbi:MAG TPA: membrane protein insertase YidC, partial [Acidobacteriota bacterium]|nr:membrane protein insertase YidC [Acidobacteriota bacterium]
VLSFVVILGFQLLFKGTRPVPRPPVPTEAAPVSPMPATTAQAQPQAKPALPEAKPAPAAPAPAQGTVAGQTEADVVIETSLYRAVWSNKGGVLKSWVLKDYMNKAKGNWLSRFIDKTLRKSASQEPPQPLDLVPTRAAEFGYPFSVDLGLDDKALAAKLNASLYQVSTASLDLADGKTGELRFVFSDGASLQAEKIFRFTGGTYALDTEVRVWKSGQPVSPWVLWGPGLSNLTDADLKKSFSAARGSAIFTGGKVVRMSEGRSKQGPGTFSSVDWAAYEGNYFAAIFVLPSQRGQAVFQQEPREGQEPGYFLYVTEPRQAFIGPKGIDELKAFGYNSKKVIKFSTFGSIAEILLVAVKFFHSLVPNWGLAIILLTIAIKIVFFPLTYSSTKSMAKMADLQPKIKAIRNKYKKAKTDIDQRRQMNEEMMRLYKEQGVNPAGGCLPLLIQMPVLWGIFRMLVVAVELRHAPFALWITDLSAQDPIWVTPILMGITQYISQKMTPTSADPSQAKMMLLMPFVMTIFFINFQSGLVLYWLTSNVLQIGQQAIMNKMMHKAKEKAKAR